MLASELLDILHDFVKEDPKRSGFAVSVAEFEDDEGTEFLWKRVGAVHWDEDNELFLVPHGLEDLFDLEEGQLTVLDLSRLLELNKHVSKFSVNVRAKAKRLEDSNGVASLNMPIWGAFDDLEEETLYFVYGKYPSESSSEEE